MGHRLASAEGEAGGDRRGGEVAGLAGGGGVVVVGVARPPAQPRSIGPDGRSAQALAAPAAAAAQEIAAGDWPSTIMLGLGGGAIIAWSAGATQVGGRGVARGGGGGGGGLIRAQAWRQGGAIGAVVVGVGGACVALGGGRHARHPGGAVSEDPVGDRIDYEEQKEHTQTAGH